jgi:hypothetical protein
MTGVKDDGLAPGQLGVQKPTEAYVPALSHPGRELDRGALLRLEDLEVEGLVGDAIAPEVLGGRIGRHEGD